MSYLRLIPAYRISLGFSRYKPTKNAPFLYGFSRARTSDLNRLAILRHA